MSTIQVDRIIPYQSSSVTIEGLSAPNLATTGSNTFVGNQVIQGTLTASLQQGFALVGGVGNVSTLVATSSFGGALPSGVVSGSAQISSLGFATTGSNTFNGDQTITGVVTISGSSTTDLRVVGNQVITGSLDITSSAATGFAIINRTNTIGQYFGNTFGGNIGIYTLANLEEIGFALDGAEWTTNWGNGPIIYVNNTSGDTYEGVFGFQNKTTYTDGRITALKRLDVSGSINPSPNNEYRFQTGSNQQAGTAVLDGGNPGTVTVSNNLVTANSIIILTKQTLGHSGAVGVSSKGSNTFTITSTANGDNDTVG